MKKEEKENLEREEQERYVEQLVQAVNEDFKERQKERAVFERQWELNMNFLSGNQYCAINGRGEIVADGKEFYWQNKETYNHIAPIMESRLAKFARVSPTVYVRPKSDDDKDVMASSLAEKIISGAFKRSDIQGVVKKVTTWSEVCGTGFYKIVWDNKGGNVVGEVDGQTVYEGDVDIIAVSPFEVFPDNLYADDLKDCASIIHAKAVSVDEIKEKYGVIVDGKDVGIFDLTKPGKAYAVNKNAKVMKNAVTVIERYERTSARFPNGRLVVVAGDKLLYLGELPYVNGESKSRIFPFVKQVSLKLAGNFFGTSVIERLIPVQRAFNAVKNRKHELMNRLSMGILTVEDGSIDVDELAEEGLNPGKVLVYRQGAKAPELMSDKTMPEDFNTEEDKLMNLFVSISGVSDVSSSGTNAKLSSGSALEILVEQDNSRLTATAEEIRRSYLEIARQTIRMYAQFTEGVRTVKYLDGANKIRVAYADERAVNSDDVYLESENELLTTHNQKKQMVFKLYESGLLTDETGKLRPSTKEKILSLLGYKDLDYQKGVSRLQEEKAEQENERMRKEQVAIEEIDDDPIHVDEHVRYVLSEYKSLNEEQKQRYYKHLREHRERINQNKEIRREN